MNTDETTTEEGVEEVVVEETVEAEGEESSEAETETQTQENLQTDYKAKYDELQKRIANDAFRFRKQKRGDEGEQEEGDEPDPDKPLTMAEVQRILNKQEQKLTKQLSNKQALSIAGEMTANEDEAKYAVALWESVELPFDSMEEQMRFIVAGMNAERILAQNHELKRTIQSKTTARKNTATTTRDPQSSGQPKVNPQVAAALKNTGYTYNTSQKVFSKKLANGKTMFNDGKGKTWVG